MELTDEQRINTLMLIDHLQNNVADEDYNHQIYYNGMQSCALGHAARIGIGGLHLHSDALVRLGGRPSLDGIFAANIVFGPKAYNNVFDTSNDFDRKAAILALRLHAKSA